MMNGTWQYFRSERQAIGEENIFHQQHARMNRQPFRERFYVSGSPICPESPDASDPDWQRGMICF